MNGAESVIRTLLASGVDTCFANPGTSEMHLVSAFDLVDGMRPVLCLFEGVVTGCADGYARMAEKPAATLLHLGPGLANGLANLHNARRACSPIVNLVGDHASHHARYDAPLASDIEGIARPVSAWVRKTASAATAAKDTALAVQAARAAPGQIATLILPADAAWLEADGVAGPQLATAPATVSDSKVALVAKAFERGRAAILMRGSALVPSALEDAGKIADKTGCRLLCDTFAPKLDRGAGIVAVERIPYFAEKIVEFFRDVDVLILVGAKPPVAFFAYPDKPSWCLPEKCCLLHLSYEHEDGPGALAALASALGAAKRPVRRVTLVTPDRPVGKFNPYTIGVAMARHLPEGAIISDDSATAGAPIVAALSTARPHTHLALTGGAIGQGLPVGAGAAVACPTRKVVCLSGDGSGLYTPQALWTMARERLDVTVIIFANRSYKILNLELDRVGAGSAGPKAKAMLDLDDPEVDWSALARGMGVESQRVDRIEEFDRVFADAMATSGPRLIEAVIK